MNSTIFPDPPAKIDESIWRPPADDKRYIIGIDPGVPVLPNGYPAAGDAVLCSSCNLPKVLGLDVDWYSCRGKRGWKWRKRCRECIKNRKG